MKLTFWGAARQVTGSMFLLELNDSYKILIDCGTDYDHRHNNSPSKLFNFNPAELDLVLLTHAHLDHSGNIPLLFLNGYKGQVLCTSSTLSLVQILLNDSASLNGKKLKKRISLNGKSLYNDNMENLYLEKQVQDATTHFVTLPFNQTFEVRKGLRIIFIPTGHLLGAANIVLEVDEDGTTKKIAFSGDLGRANYPLLKDPQGLPQVDYVVCESTYGNRYHEDENPEELLEEVITRTCVDISGRLIIPAFSTGRTQSLLYVLNKLHKKGKLPRIKIFADSPMALLSTKIYEEYVDQLNDEAQEFDREHGGLFDFDNLIQIDNYKDSKAISNYYEPCIIISSSGMLSGGRMQMHIKKNIRNPYSTILLVGYSAEGTPGYDLVRGNRTLRLKGKSYPVAANVVTTDVFSGHADRDDLINFIKPQKNLKKVFLVHGEVPSLEAFKEGLQEEGFKDVVIPDRGESFEL